MAVLYGVLVALAGGLAALAGLAGAYRRRRLRGHGLTAWATIVPTPIRSGERDEFGLPAAALPRQLSLQFALEDGRIIERPYPRPARHQGELALGGKVLVWYDAADPGDVLVFSRDGRWSDRAFVAAGALFIVVGASLASLGHLLPRPAAPAGRPADRDQGSRARARLGGAQGRPETTERSSWR